MDTVEVGTEQYCSTPEELADLDVARPTLQFNHPEDQRQERMRHLAHVFIEMFQARRLSERKRLTASEDAV